VYVYNDAPNARMKTPGLYATMNDGFAWRHAEARGLSGKHMALAVHPTDSKTIAVAISTGLFLSRNGGERFERAAGGGRRIDLTGDAARAPRRRRLAGARDRAGHAVVAQCRGWQRSISNSLPPTVARRAQSRRCRATSSKSGSAGTTVRVSGDN
jgi:hypothetical protein